MESTTPISPRLERVPDSHLTFFSNQFNPNSMFTTTQVAPTSAPTTNRRTLDATAAMNILNSRKTLTTKLIGEQIVLSVSGNGQFLPAGFEYSGPGGVTTNQFDRTIYNLRANSQLSMLRKETKQLLASAMKAQSAGDTEAASQLFNDWLNTVQISFSVIERGSSRPFATGDMVTAVVAEVTNKAGERQLVVNDVRYKAPTQVESIKFELSDLLDISDDDVDPIV